MIYNHVMVDLETTGTNPNHNAMIQLAAVRFNLEHRDVDTNVFDQSLLIPGNRYWAEDTREWWATQNQDILRKIWSRMRDPRQVILEFVQWTMRDLDGEKPILWAKPTHFESPFIESYCREHGIANPFHYSDSEDLKSHMSGRGMRNLDREIPFDGEAHDAIDDCFHQITTLFTCYERTEVKIHDPA